MVVFAAALEARAFAATVTTEELGEEIAEIGGTGVERAASGKLEAGVPVRGRPELLAGAIALSQLVVGDALFGIRKHRVGFVHVLHPRFGILLLRNVRMIFARQFAERLLDLVLRRFARYA